MSEFLARVCAERGGRRLWLAKVRAAHERAAHSVVSSERLEAAALEARRIVARYDLLLAQLAEVQGEVEALLGEIEEARWLATIPGLGFASGHLHGDHLLPHPQPRAQYDRLISRPDRPLAKMTALGACMNKLLLWAFAVMSKRRAFELEHEWKECAA